MTHLVLSDTAASIGELKNNPLKTVAAGGGLPVAIFKEKFDVVIFTFFVLVIGCRLPCDEQDFSI